LPVADEPRRHPTAIEGFEFKRIGDTLGLHRAPFRKPARPFANDVL
jgi:hypothetical protein